MTDTRGRVSDSSRRAFLKGTGAAAIGAVSVGAAARSAGAASFGAPEGPVAISSGNGAPAVTRARELMLRGVDTALSVVEGVGIVEADPDDMSVGYGGLPNERGVVQLDASVMHGPTHKAGSVAALEDVVHAAGVALKVLQTTDHVMIVGAGAREFAIAHGFPIQNMLTDRAREAWLRWKQNASSTDDWLDEDQRDWDREGTKVGRADEKLVDPFTYGTIHCAAVNGKGDVSACTTTSGLSYKIPGRVGDSPIIGAGMFVDNEVGSGGATGRGEAVIQSCGAYAIVRAMERGLEPEQACLEVLGQIARKSVLQKRHRGKGDRVNFNVVLYALRKDGAHGSACMLPSRSYTVADAQGTRSIPCATYFD
jgi:N4-(beta-N-acetylglucosaminyl)-L-asparaginase